MTRSSLTIMVYLYMSDQTSLILISEKQIACKLEGFFLRSLGPQENFMG
jgi:hypothetical protein